jgi:hypothetical protein
MEEARYLQYSHVYLNATMTHFDTPCHDMQQDMLATIKDVITSLDTPDPMMLQP